MGEQDSIISNQKCMVAFIFDSGRFDTYGYGRAAFEAILEGKELKKNPTKIVISVGDILNGKRYIDISPYVIMDEMCSISFKALINNQTSQDGEDKHNNARFVDSPFVVLMEDIDMRLAQTINARVHDICKAYIGMTSIDIKSTDQRKQFWKHLVRLFSLEMGVCTVFGESEAGFSYEELFNNAGYNIRYDEFPYGMSINGQGELFSTRQSSFITHIEQLKFIDGKNDSDREVFNMNFALVKEVELAGVEIWSAIEAINKVYLEKDSEYIIVDYIFMSFYQAAQGIERLLKIIVELVVYMNKDKDKSKTDELLYSHNHIALADYLEKKKIIKLESSCRKLLYTLSKFYNEARYNRYADCSNDMLESSLLNELGRKLKKEDFNDEFKKFYGKLLGKVSRILYKAIGDLSYKLNIYVYELNSTSVACKVFYDSYQENLYKSLLECENAKREIIWYLICNGSRIQNKYKQVNIPPVPFEDVGLNEYVSKMEKNNLDETDIVSYIDEVYEEMRNNGKDDVKLRKDFLSYLFSSDSCEEHFFTEAP